MEGAQCFIEVWKPKIKTKTIYSTHGDIEYLHRSLESTKRSGFTTIAIWYIKPKKSNP